MRLIDADALMRQVTEEKREAPNWDYAVGYRDAINRVQCMIGEAPTVAEDNNVPIKHPDPITGLVPCGCGGKAIMLCDLEYAVACEKCLINLPYAFDTKELARQAWNTARGYTTPPQPSAMEEEK